MLSQHEAWRLVHQSAQLLPKLGAKCRDVNPTAIRDNFEHGSEGPAELELSFINKVMEQFLAEGSVRSRSGSVFQMLFANKSLIASTLWLCHKSLFRENLIVASSYMASTISVIVRELDDKGANSSSSSSWKLPRRDASGSKNPR